jgi:hypothetical protein
MGGARRSDLVLAVGVIGILTVLVAPLPALLLDFLLTTNLTLALLILFVAMYVRRPLEFSVFPSLLLVATLYRLSLNVAATRLILLHGGEGPGAAGRVIQGFGEYVVGGNFIVGVVLFLILIVIQFVVITKGAGRIAEVAARFTLDAMPGKQMAIDADLNAGLIAEQEARQRREQVGREADFYGAMDGASKFVRGDAVAALVITAINIIGGFAIGVFQEGLPLMDALDTYTTLTVGDGLVAQLPALVTSTAAGIVVTRAASDSDLSHDLLGQLTERARPLAVAAAVLGVLGPLPRAARAAVPGSGRRPRRLRLSRGSCREGARARARGARGQRPRERGRAAAHRPAAARRRLRPARARGAGREERRPARAHPAAAPAVRQRHGLHRAADPRARQRRTRHHAVRLQGARRGGRARRGLPRPAPRHEPRRRRRGHRGVRGPRADLRPARALDHA